MPQRTNRSGKSLLHTLFLATVRRERRQLIMQAKARKKKVRVAPRRLAASLAFATLFFAGAALSAGAGNTVTKLFDQASDSALSDSTSTETSTNEDPAPAAADLADAAARAQAPAEAPDPNPTPASADLAEAAAQAQTPSSNTQAAGVQAALSNRMGGTAAKQPTAKASAQTKALSKARSWAPKSFRPS